MLRVFESGIAAAEQYADLPLKEAIGIEYFSRLLSLYKIRHEQAGPLFTFEDGRSLYVKTTATKTKHQLCVRTWAEGAKIVVFARLDKWPDPHDMLVRNLIEFRGYASRNFITGRYKPVKYRGLAEAYKVPVDKLLPMTDLIDWLVDCYGEKTQAA